MKSNELPVRPLPLERFPNERFLAATEAVFIYTAYDNGVAVQLWKRGRHVGMSFFYRTWAEALDAGVPLPHVPMFVEARTGVFLPR